MSYKIPSFAYVRADCCSLDVRICEIVGASDQGKFTVQVLGQSGRSEVTESRLSPMATSADAPEGDPIVALPARYGGFWFIFEKTGKVWVTRAQAFNQNDARRLAKGLRLLADFECEIPTKSLG